jgi:hypothetical protein
MRESLGLYVFLVFVFFLLWDCFGCFACAPFSGMGWIDGLGCMVGIGVTRVLTILHSVLD